MRSQAEGQAGDGCGALLVAGSTVTDRGPDVLASLTGTTPIRSRQQSWAVVDASAPPLRLTRGPAERLDVGRRDTSGTVTGCGGRLCRRPPEEWYGSRGRRGHRPFQALSVVGAVSRERTTEETVEAVLVLDDDGDPSYSDPDGGGSAVTAILQVRGTETVAAERPR